MIKSVGIYLNKPHEKMFAVAVLVIVFSAMYHTLYTLDKNHFHSEKYDELTYGHFLWYSLMITFTMPFGEIYPYTHTSKALTGMQGVMFWFTMLGF